MYIMTCERIKQFRPSDVVCSKYHFPIMAILQLQSIPLSRHPQVYTFQSFHLRSKLMLILTVIVGGQRYTYAYCHVTNTKERKTWSEALERIREIGVLRNLFFSSPKCTVFLIFELIAINFI